MSMKWHKKTDIAFFIEEIEKRRVKMSEIADEQALPGSAAGRVLVPTPQAASGESSGQIKPLNIHGIRKRVRLNLDLNTVI